MNPIPVSSTDRPRLSTPADLLASVPALLGFHPTNSLVVLGLRHRGAERRIDCALRTDLPANAAHPGPPAPEPAALARQVAALGCPELVLVVVGGGGWVPGQPPPRGEVVEQVVGCCAQLGLVVRTALWVAETAENAPWSCYDGCGCSGRLADPRCTELFAETVAGGQVIYADRGEVERLVAEGDAGVLQRRSQLLADRIDRALRSGIVEHSGPAGLALVQQWVERFATRSVRLTDSDVVELCLALSDPSVRDVCIGFATDERADGARRLWTTLLGEAPDPEAAEPAVLLAACALARQDGVLAGVALDRAQRAWPGHRLSELFCHALRGGCSPEQLVRWLSEGAARARQALFGLDDTR